MRKVIYGIIVMMFLGFQRVYALDSHIPVRVGISDTSFKTYLFNTAEFNNAADLQVTDSATGYTLPTCGHSSIVKVTSENNLFRIYLDGELKARNLSGPILISPKEGSLISVTGLKRKGREALYRGYMELVRSSKDMSRFSIVNVLSLKNYLRGVVPNEMPVKFGLEALKAQSVAARNYAVAPRVKAYQEFDLCDSVACQVYFGANTEEELSDIAIEQTNGIIALDNNNSPVLALYSSAAGGYTESYKYVFSNPLTKEFPSEDIPYLAAAADNESFGSLETDEKAELFYKSSPVSFDDNSPYYRWTKEWSVNELESVLKKTLPIQSKTGFISPAILDGEDFGPLVSIKALQRGKSGKIISLEIKTEKNTYIVQKELVIRRCFQKDGISLPSANFVIDYAENDGRSFYKFTGGGFGHGVGMSQWGAGKMASMGYSFEQILKHYYKGIKLASVPADIHRNNKTAQIIFYTEGKTAKIYVQNYDDEQKARLVINNNKEFDICINGELTVIDISEYLNKGVNKISCTISGDYDISKKLTLFAEIAENESDIHLFEAEYEE